MRKLVILRGAMGCGKSTFIKENNLESYTISSDKIRLLFNAPEMDINYGEIIPQFNNKKVWNLLYYLLEERMKKGEFTVIDAVHAYYNESLIMYKKLAEKYRYRLYILDFTDIPKKEVYKRNLMREKYKIVPEYAIDRVYKIFSKEKIPSSFKIIKPEKFNEIINNTPKNFDMFNKIHIIGDIHGCYSALKTYFDNHPINKNEAYIFVGDYFDRGIENYDTFQYLNELMNNESMIFLVGNHEDKLYKYACDDEFKMDYDIQNTIKEFEEKKIRKSEIRGFIEKLSQIAYFNFNDNTYLVSHGGIPYIPERSLDFYSTNSFIYGISEYDINIDKLYNDFMEKHDDKVYQIHGHRNFYKLKYNEYKYSINLEGAIEHGEYLRVLTLDKNEEPRCTEIKNEMYNSNLIDETNVYSLIESLRKNKYIFERNLGDDIFSFNFSKEAFYNKVWNDMTTQARGLFINVKNNKIVARSYNKFFNINERKETELETLESTLLFPVHFYLKYNGFLGILSVNNNELFFASKSTNVGNYVEYFKNIFYNTFNDKQIEEIKKKLMNDNLTFVFEVIDPVNDSHIIKYNNPKLILLDGIKNSTEFLKMSFEELKKFADKNNIELKEQSYIIENLEKFKEVYSKVVNIDFKYNDDYIEGFVIEDKNNLMVKIKTNYYNEWKYLRSKMEYSIKNNNYDLKFKNNLEKSFLAYIENKYKNRNVDLKTINIINERDEFISKNSSEDI